MNWRLTRDRVGRPVVQQRYDEDTAWPANLLREMARDDPTMTELADGVWRVEKPHPTGSWSL